MTDFELQNNGTEEEEKKKHGAGFYIGIVIAIAAIILALILGIFMFMESTQQSNRGGALGQLDGKSMEEIQAELDKIVEEGMMNISIASVVEFENADAEGEIKIENSPANSYLMRVEIARSDNGEVVYTSPILEPNYHVQTAKLDEHLDKGTYPCVATFYAIDPDTEQEVGQAAAQMTIVMKN